ncbi:hypothetical protein GGI12_003461 [Dipsacomyces acuminosporus]|nr:hypothetical protein GGI12_003461 [Dipsacomyces acuminosporus]
MDGHIPFPEISDQSITAITSQQHTSAIGYPAIGMSPMTAPMPPHNLYSTFPPQTHYAGVAPINTQCIPSPHQFAKSPSSSATSPTIVYSSKVTQQPNCTVYCYDKESNVMEQKVRQFYSADGTSFIEHVPGHCLVFIPNSTNVNYVLRELRKIRQPKTHKKPKEKSLKPTNAFIKYRNHKIEELKMLHPEISQTDISRMAGECWKSEKEEVKGIFRKQYMEEKRVYDLNKAKRARTESEDASDTDTQSDSQSTASHTTATSVASRAVPHGTDATGLGLGLGLGLDLGLGLGSLEPPTGFARTRRRSHTLPSGGFSRSSSRRRISQELRKHLASKSNVAYITAAAATSAQLESAEMQQQQQQQQPGFDFTFTAPQMDSASSMSSINGSPYLGNSSSNDGSSMSPLVMPINPGFPMAEFSSSNKPTSFNPHHQHTRSLTSIPTGLTVDTSALSVQTDAFESFTPDQGSLTGSLVDAGLSAGLSMINTPSISALSTNPITSSVDNASPFLVDTSASVLTSNALTSGYLSTDTPPLVSSVNTWPLAQAYSMVADNNLSPQ